MLAEGDLVVGRWTSTGTHQGELMGIPPTGVKVTGTGISILQIANGKSKEEWVHWDALGMMQQIGVMPPNRETYTWGMPTELTGDPGDPETNKAIVQRMLDEVMNEQDLTVIDELFAVDYLMHDPAWPMEVKGPDGFKQWAGAMLEPFFSDSQITGIMIAEEDKVVVNWTWSGTHAGEFMDIPPTGRRITVGGISIHRFADGKFVESWASYDSMGMMEQLTTPEWPIEGTWIMTVPSPLGNMIFRINYIAQDTSKTNFTAMIEQISSLPVLIDLYPEGDNIKFAGGQVIKTGLNSYEATLIQYFTKNSGTWQEEIVGIAVINGSMVLTGPESALGQGTGAYYLAMQDADGDGLPDEGEESVLCAPWMWTKKRITMMPPCVPTPLPAPD